MPTKTHSSPVAHAYARSLLELANETKVSAEMIGQELAELRKIVSQNQVFKMFLEDPAIGETERKAFLEKVFRGRVSQLLLNFLGVLNDKGRLRKLEEIAEAYEDLLDEQLGKVEVDVTVAQRLRPEQLEAVRQKVTQVLKKDAVIHQYVDESIIGGLILRVGDKLLDASTKSQLEAMRQKLMEAPVTGQL